MAESEAAVIVGALHILHARLKTRDAFASSEAIKDYLRLQGQGLEHEVFAVMYLDIQTVSWITNAFSEEVSRIPPCTHERS